MKVGFFDARMTGGLILTTMLENDFVELVEVLSSCWTADYIKLAPRLEAAYISFDTKTLQPLLQQFRSRTTQETHPDHSLSMATSRLGLNLSAVSPALPYITGALYLLGLGGGVYNYIDPAGGAAGFGILVGEPDGTSAPQRQRPSRVETAYIKVHGIRNVGMGLTGLALLSYLHFSPVATASVSARNAVRQVIGLSLILGTVVGLGDVAILREVQAASSDDGERSRLAGEKSVGHAVMAVPIALLGVAWWFA